MRKYATASERANASSCASEPPASWIGRPSATTKRPLKPRFIKPSTTRANGFVISAHMAGALPRTAIVDSA